MKAIVKTIKPKTCANIMNRNQSILVIKNKREATAIQKLIDENGYADIYAYCSKSNTQYLVGSKNKVCEILTKAADTRFSPNIGKYTGNGKVLFKFRCYEMEEILNYGLARRSEMMMEELLKGSCLTMEQLNKYAPHKEYDDDDYIYTIHISDLEIFDQPKELSEFYKVGFDKALKESLNSKPYPLSSVCIEKQYQLTKAPQNMCYVEVE